MFQIVETLPGQYKTVDDVVMNKIYLSFHEWIYCLLHTIKHWNKDFFWHMIDESFTKSNWYTGPRSEWFATQADAIRFCFEHRRIVYEFDNFFELSKFIVSEFNS